MIRIKNNKGISMLSLVISITIIMVLTGAIIYNLGNNLETQNLEAMQSDIENLRGKISTYYAQNGKIPALVQYANANAINKIRKTGVISTVSDVGKFFVIDLSALDNLTLNYGKEFDYIKKAPDTADNYSDIYIINETSHNIFYVEGIKIDKEIIYTDYTNEDIDTAEVELKYVDNIKIPDGFSYVEGSKDTQITIKNSDDTKEYKWTKITKAIQDIPNNVSTYHDEQGNKNIEDFIKSVNAYKGYYLDSSKDVIYLSIDKWSPKYDKEGTYKDKHGDTTYIPEGAQVSQLPGEDTIDEGLVIKDKNENEWVWIDVPKSIYQNATSNEEYDLIEQDMKSYCENYIDENYSDTWYDGCGITNENDYNKLKNEMLARIYDRGGFYIGRYEAGLNTQKTNGVPTDGVETLIDTNGLPLIQKNKYPYNFVTCGQAEQLAGKMEEGTEYKTSLLFGIQWDLALKFIETKEAKKVSEIKIDSTSWGNYSEEQGMLTTGSKNRNSALNIYDLAGNLWEWTLENKNVARGGSYDAANEQVQASSRINTLTQDAKTTFRIALY